MCGCTCSCSDCVCCAIGKLDAVREVAGNVLYTLVMQTDPYIHFIPERSVIVRSILDLQKLSSIQYDPLSSEVAENAMASHFSSQKIDWGKPSLVFKFLMSLCEDCEVLFHGVVSGLVTGAL